MKEITFQNKETIRGAPLKEKKGDAKPLGLDPDKYREHLER